MSNNRLLIKTCTHIIRKTQAHFDCAFKKYGLSSGSYPYLLALSDEEGISLDKISKKLGVDKAMSTRTIQKLLAQGYLTKTPDMEDLRAFRLYLTDRARDCIPKVRGEIIRWIDVITDGLTEQEKDTVVRLLLQIEANADKIESKRMDETQWK